MYQEAGEVWASGYEVATGREDWPHAHPHVPTNSDHAEDGSAVQRHKQRNDPKPPLAARAFNCYSKLYEAIRCHWLYVLFNMYLVVMTIKNWAMANAGGQARVRGFTHLLDTPVARSMQQNTATHGLPVRPTHNLSRTASNHHVKCWS